MRVFKYRGGDKEILKRDLRSIVDDTLYSAPIDSLNDIFEFKVLIDEESFNFNLFNNNIEHEFFKNGLIDILLEYIKVAHGYGVYSLSKSYSDELLWTYYANSHQGFCIEYELDELVAYSLNDEYITDVDYQKSIPTITSVDLLNIKGGDDNYRSINRKLIATKSKKWGHECEVRIVTGTSGLHKYDFRSLKAIYFGHRAKTSFIKTVMKVLKGREIKYYKMNPQKDSYILDRVEINDKYSDGFKYRSELATVEEGAIYLTESNEMYNDVLLKAIEIARREPYSKTITMADLSVNKGSADNPVIYVYYLTEDDKGMKLYLSKDEIDKFVL
ncbi:TPA: DUF2971 domain-containing protein [Yersinia enterocolitica]|uniref:DUF2971 domain-containing protein n=1 Tax=Yersinia enterocolitica W22703 TaxID=913028 RepID=F4MXM1_YEREN|nr:DUF2971 domain-containing protein [Yersinia enterocolitica]CBX70579.1 hypothetical protein YEW_KV45890 [Yersinia enterocolitica W22703]ADZ43341.1 hypothetical protein YE105_C2845 [Yersinia enterocolitica subsp. palearctica 105.5R(r)]ALG79435.1 hypothetical protein XM56_13875 [Yersinia enterocolitica]KGA67185.1 hypothetical protein DJ61_3594 [Yersinia enterocolitica]KGA79131.1 hypothetical protein DJ62_3760 [Yersinia enterocolitica]